MCILFVKTEPNPGPDRYCLVLANIRDEYLWRPTKRAHIWDDKHSSPIVGGRDMQTGREGGTWLAINESGKVASLLNILVQNNQVAPDKKSRGVLVVDYLDSNCSPKTYFEKVSEQSDDYNGFRMIGLQVGRNAVEAAVYCSVDNKVIDLNPGVHAFGNNRIEGKLWPKVKNGREMFEQIVNKYDRLESKESLVDSLFHMMADQTQYGVDQQMSEQGMDKDLHVLERMSALNVMVREAQYGSRTRTLVLIDSAFNVDYIERTMEEPIDANQDIQWITSHKRFKLEVQ